MPGKLWALDRDSFQMLLMTSANTRKKQPGTQNVAFARCEAPDGDPYGRKLATVDAALTSGAVSSPGRRPPRQETGHRRCSFDVRRSQFRCFGLGDGPGHRNFDC